MLGPWVENTWLAVVLGALLLVNAAGVFLVIMQMPGTWLIVLCTTLVAWWRPATISPWTLGALVALAFAGELIELAAGSAGARRGGGSKRAALLALVGAMVGALAGTLLLAIIGSLIGACLGAALGSIFGDRWAGRSWPDAVQTGKGAAKGRFLGTIGKTTVAAVMWLIVALAIFA